MGKGMRAGKRPKKQGGGNMQQQMQQMQAVQRQMDEIQAQIDEMEATATSGGGAVSVTVSGKKELKDIRIQPDVVDPEDVEMLQDLILAAVNGALKKADDETSKAMNKLQGGMGGFPGLF